MWMYPVFGMVLGSLLEYTIHRFIHSKKGRRSSVASRAVRKHSRHHAVFSSVGAARNYCYSRRDQAKATSQLLLVSIVVWLSFVRYPQSVISGVCMHGWFYNLAHQLCHTRTLTPKNPLVRFHYEHHRHPSRNLGVSMPFWDVCMGTLSEGGCRLRHPALLPASLLPIVGHWCMR